MRAVEVKSFGDESEKFKALAKISKEICERYVEQNTSKSLYLAQILIGKLLKKYKQQFENENDFKMLQTLEQEIIKKQITEK